MDFFHLESLFYFNFFEWKSSPSSKVRILTTFCNPFQDEIKPHMRKIVVDWMLEVCLDQHCHPDVFLLAVNIMDRFLGTIRLKKKQFQLLGACAIFLASKMIEPSPIPALTLVKYTADTYDREELLVSTVDWFGILVYWKIWDRYHKWLVNCNLGEIFS